MELSVYWYCELKNQKQKKKKMLQKERNNIESANIFYC